MQTKQSKMKTALILALCASMLLATAVPAAAAQKISNPGNFGRVDGIAQDSSVGKHNSYAWCAEMFAQADADYLWVGMNRDIGRTLLAQAGDVIGNDLAVFADFIGTYARLPQKSQDQMGKIYRQRAADTDAPWELMYENPAINGYRRMILFQGCLYVCAGLTNTPEYDYSVILRFSPDFKAGDEPEIVLWEDLPRAEDGGAAAAEYYRAACVYRDRLYIGTFDSKIYVTDGKGLTGLTPKRGAKSTGWELFADLKRHPDFPDNAAFWPNTNYLWDLIGFNGSIYAFVTDAGFNVFKLTPGKSGRLDIKQIVGSAAGAMYSDGVGLEGLIAASPFLASFGGKDYVYVSTFDNGPMLLGDLGRGELEHAFGSLACPPSIFRFDAQDRWETVVGDTTGKHVAKDKAGNPLPVIGNQRAGFFTGCEPAENIASTHYIWWMAQYGGRLYASTWDLGVFKRHSVEMSNLSLLIGFINGADLELLYALQAIGDAQGAPAFFSSLGNALQLLAASLGPMVRSFFNAIPALSHVVQHSQRTNPGGFDIFASEDGVNFSPVTVDGFGNRENYGGRVLLPTAYGLFVCTANPFGGGQVWRLDDAKEELQPNIPATVRLRAGETFKASVRGIALPRGAQVAMEGTGGSCAEIRLAPRSSGVIIDTQNNVRRIGPQYIETRVHKRVPAQMYDVVFTGKAAGQQDVTLRFTWNGVEAARTVKVIVTA